MTTQEQTAEMTLDQLQPGGEAIVVELRATGPERRRFMDLGLLPGTRVRATMRSPLGDPVAYEIRETLVALRRTQARQISVRSVEENDS